MIFSVCLQAPNYCVRKLDVTRLGGGEEEEVGEEEEGGAGVGVAGHNRVIIHLQLTDWPDRAAPGHGHAGHLVQLVQLTHVMVNTHSGGAGGPLLVHCSAGVGRTGTFICVDQIINNIDTSPCSDVDIFHTVYKLRRQR